MSKKDEVTEEVEVEKARLAMEEIWRVANMAGGEWSVCVV